jgi:GNAT superfamily N-acetyltransferase
VAELALDRLDAGAWRIISEAAVCRRSCSRSPAGSGSGRPGWSRRASASFAAPMAGLKRPGTNLDSRSGPPRGAVWLASRGIDQWQEPWPTEDLMVEGMLRNTQAGETFIVWDDDTPAATITINRWAKPEPWTEQERAEPALYAHKVTVDRAYGGQGLGAELLDWAGTRAADEGAVWLRVDVWTTNERLQHYYLEQGFTYVRTVVLPHNPSGALFQRPAQRLPTPRLVDDAKTRVWLGACASRAKWSRAGTRWTISGLLTPCVTRSLVPALLNCYAVAGAKSAARAGMDSIP